MSKISFYIRNISSSSGVHIINSNFSLHIPALHPGKDHENIKDRTKKRQLWKEDYANRSKIQCFLCNYAGAKASHLKRHYTEVHGYNVHQDASNDIHKPDPDDPDGALCPECGEHFVNKVTLILHLLKEHSCPKGEQCLYCPNRYMDVPSHVDKLHKEEKDKPNQVCKKCGVGSSQFSSFEALFKHTMQYHRKGPNDLKDRNIDGNNYTQKHTAKRLSMKKRIAAKNCQNKKNKNLEKSSSENVLKGKDGLEIVPEKDSVNDESLNDESMDGFGCVSTGKRKKYKPQHLSGICPFCELKFSDLLGHIRHKCHGQSETGDIPSTDVRKMTCSLCQETFNSVRALVTHRQLHPQFKNHCCTKCGSEFETVVFLRTHRATNCPKMKKKKKKKTPQSYLQEIKKLKPEPTSNHSGTPTEDSERGNAEELKPSSTQTAHLSTLLKMVNDLNTNNITASSIIQEEPKPKPIEYEGRGTVKCHICLKSFTIKSLLRRHYISHHCYEPDKVQSNLCLIDSENDDTKPEASCIECNRYFGNVHARIKVRGQYEIHFYICKKY